MHFDLRLSKMSLLEKLGFRDFYGFGGKNCLCRTESTSTKSIHNKNSLLHPIHLILFCFWPFLVLILE